MNTGKVRTCGTCTHAMCTCQSTEPFESARYVSRREPMNIVTILAKCFEKVNSGTNSKQHKQYTITPR